MPDGELFAAGKDLGHPAPDNAVLLPFAGSAPFVEDHPGELDGFDQAARVAQETARFAEEVDVHDLPPIFHYWSDTYLRPKLEHLGAKGIDDYFANALGKVLDGLGRPARFVSLGAGNCDTEVRVSKLLCGREKTDFILDCVELTPAMVDRGRDLTRSEGMTDRVRPMVGDLNSWRPEHQYDAVLANQSLHHVVNLEGLFDAVAAGLAPEGRFITSDMIGRNGHQRWPEARAIVEEFWAELPENYRYHLQLRRHEEHFLDWDCSVEGFEGIRSQDILPMLLDRFEFEEFLAFGNVIDPFIDRGFGPHFDPDNPWDRSFIDRVHARDEAELAAGTITPTHLIATLRLGDGPAERRIPEASSPRSCSPAMRPTAPLPG